MPATPNFDLTMFVGVLTVIATQPMWFCLLVVFMVAVIGLWGVHGIIQQERENG